MEDNNSPSASVRASGSYGFLSSFLNPLGASQNSSDSDIPNSNNSTLEQAYQQATFHNYTLKKNNNKPLHSFVLGCQGSASDNQKAVAELMAKIADNPDHKPDFVLILGDNFYDDGVNSPTSPAFKDYFYDMYKKLELMGIPFFVALGNHDANRHAKTFYKKIGKEWTYQTPPPFGSVVEKNQIMHSYLSNEDQRKIFTTSEAAPHANPEKIALYQKDELNLSEMPTWNMPDEAYGLHDDNIQIFVINSNNYLRDYLKEDTTGKNQTAWLATEYKKAKDAGKKIIFAMHHPVATEGKRAFPNKYDSTHYLSPEKLAALKKKLGTKTDSYNELLALAFEKQDIWADQFWVAHDHFINYRNTHLDDKTPRKFSQMTLGGGGGDHHPRRSFLGYPYSFHLEANGFAEMELSAEGIHATIHTTDGKSFQFTEQNHLPIKPFIHDEKMEELRKNILSLCYKQLAVSKQAEEKMRDEEKPKENTSPATYAGALFNAVSTAVSAVTNTVYAGYTYVKGDPKEHIIEVTHQLMAYFNQASPLPDYKIVYENLNDIIKTLEKYNDNEVVKFVNQVKLLLPNTTETEEENIHRSQSAPNLSSFN